MGVSALEKGLAVMEAVVAHSRLSDIVRATGLSQSTAHRVLRVLVEAGWVHRDENRLYHPGRRLHAMGGILRQETRLAEVARPHLERLRELTDLTVHFGLLTGDHITYAAKLDGAGSYRMTSHVGGMVPLHSTAIGKAVLAARSDDDALLLLPGTGLTAVTPRTITALPELLAELRTIRERGWALDDGENAPRLRCVGAAVTDGSGSAIGGVSICGLDFELDIRRAHRESGPVQAVAAAISGDLGG